jgi:NOL1/NOP2/sun family putative RNA methylase
MKLPQHFIESIKHVKGFDKEAFETVHDADEQVTSIRIHPKKTTNLKLQIGDTDIQNLVPVPWCAYGYYLEKRPSFTLDPTFHAGAYYVQEASSMFLWQAVKQIFANDTAKKVLDVCAAPGGKSSLLSSYFTNGLVVSNEVIKSRAAILVENMTKWGIDNTVITNNDPKDFVALGAYFDAIVVDAPCSGSGMFRKDATAANEWSLNNVDLCSQRQQRIIADVYEALKEEGVMIYSTCSYSKEEDEDILDWIISTLGATTIQLKIQQEWGIVETQSDKHKAFGYRFYPDKIKGEGFFIAAFKKSSTCNEVKLKQHNIPLPTKQEMQVLQSFIQLTEDYTFFKHNTEIRVVPADWFNDLKVLASYLYIKKAGTCIGEVKGKDFVPHHELAVSTLNLSNIATIALTFEQALQYLRRKDLIIETNLRGWVLATYEGFGLGWMKILPNRLNNYYPQEWRILKD